MTSLSPLSPTTQLWLALIELNLFSLVPHPLTGVRASAPYGCEFVFRPYRTDRYCEADRFVVTFPVTRFSRYGVVTEQREPAAVHHVRAALRDDVHHAAVATAVLRLVAGCLEVEFLDRFER